MVSFFSHTAEGIHTSCQLAGALSRDLPYPLPSGRGGREPGGGLVRRDQPSASPGSENNMTLRPLKVSRRTCVYEPFRHNCQDRARLQDFYKSIFALFFLLPFPPLSLPGLKRVRSSRKKGMRAVFF